MSQTMYHEKQTKCFCALHTLNNLFQEQSFNQEEFDEICRNLAPDSWVNPHKSSLGLGNYDLNVIKGALQLKDCQARWFDKTKDPAEELNFDAIFGFIFNFENDYKLGWFTLPEVLQGRHWFAVKDFPAPVIEEEGQRYYNLNSKLATPEAIGTREEFIEYIRETLKSPKKEMFIVITNEVENNQSWKR